MAHNQEAWPLGLITLYSMQCKNVSNAFRSGKYFLKTIQCITNSLNDTVSILMEMQTKYPNERQPTPDEQEVADKINNEITYLKEFAPRFATEESLRKFILSDSNEAHYIFDHIINIKKCLEKEIINHEIVVDSSDFSGIEKSLFELLGVNSEKTKKLFIIPNSNQDDDLKDFKKFLIRMKAYCAIPSPSIISIPLGELIKIGQDKPQETQNVLEEQDAKLIALGQEISFGGHYTIYSALDNDKIVTAKLLNPAFFDEEENFKMTAKTVEAFRTFGYLRSLYSGRVKYIDPHSQEAVIRCAVISEQMPVDLQARLFSRHQLPLSSTSKTIIALGVAKALNCIHNKGLVHGNVNASNIFLDQSDYPKLTGYSKFTIGTPAYMSPEYLENTLTDKADVYAYGVIFWILLTEIKPWPHYKRISGENATFEHLPIPNEAPTFIKSYLPKLWNPNYTERPTMEEIANEILNGNLIFPGTDLDIVRNYDISYNAYDQSTVHKRQSVSINTSTCLKVFQMTPTLDLTKKVIAALRFISISKTIRIITQDLANRILTTLPLLAPKVQDQDTANLMIITFVKILSVYDFSNESIHHSILTLFHKFLNPEMYHVIPYFMQNIDKELPDIQELSIFFQDPLIENQRLAIQFGHMLLNRNEKVSMVPIVWAVVNNIRLGTSNEQLLDNVSLLMEMVKLDQCRKRAMELNVMSILLKTISSSLCKIQIEILNFLTEKVDELNPLFLTSFFERAKEIITNVLKDNEEDLEKFAILVYHIFQKVAVPDLIANSICTALIANQQISIENDFRITCLDFVKLPLKPKISIVGIKALFAYIVKNPEYNPFVFESSFSSTLYVLEKVSDRETANAAMIVLTHIVNHLDCKSLSKILTSICNLFNNPYAQRLMGMIVLTRTCDTEFSVKDQTIIDTFYACMTNFDDVNTCMSFLSYSVISPESSTLGERVPLLIDTFVTTYNEKVKNYILSILSNAAIIPINAISITHRIKEILEAVYCRKVTISLKWKTVNLLSILLQSPEVHKVIAINGGFLNFAEKHWSDSNDHLVSLLYDVIEHLSSIQTIKESEEMKQFSIDFLQMSESITIADPRRMAILRIVSNFESK